MRLYSTPQSAKILEVSLLAIVENIATVSFSLWLAISYFEAWEYILLGACIAPLLAIYLTLFWKLYSLYLGKNWYRPPF